MKKVLLKDIADRICAHLKRMEADPKINLIQKKNMRLKTYYCVGCWASGARIFITYVGYQGAESLTRAEALQYLARLDAGYNDMHFQNVQQGGSVKLFAKRPAPPEVLRTYDIVEAPEPYLPGSIHQGMRRVMISPKTPIMPMDPKVRDQQIDILMNAYAEAAKSSREALDFADCCAMLMLACVSRLRGRYNGGMSTASFLFPQQ